jgi:hypothetical protein
VVSRDRVALPRRSVGTLGIHSGSMHVIHRLTCQRQLNTSPLPPANAVLATGEARVNRPRRLWCGPWFQGCLPHALNTLRSAGAEEGRANRTPSAWMISLTPPFALGQIMFFVWSLYPSTNGSFILAERGRVDRRRTRICGAAALATGVKRGNGTTSSCIPQTMSYHI